MKANIKDFLLPQQVLKSLRVDKQSLREIANAYYYCPKMSLSALREESGRKCTLENAACSKESPLKVSQMCV